MTSTVHGSTTAELDALRELTDDLFGSITRPHLHSPQTTLPYSSEAWDLLGESGLTLLTTPESAGGSGGGITEAALMLDRTGYHALPAPLFETDLLASWLLGLHGTDASSAPMTAVQVDWSPGDLRAGKIVLNRVPWGQIASDILVAGDRFVGRIRTADAKIEPVGDLVGEHYADASVSVETLEVVPTSTDTRSEYLTRGAWARSEQICGALERILDLGIAHVTERHQFGRPIGKFQAVQELISRSAGLVTTAKAATAHAAAVVAQEGFDADGSRIAVSIAKIQAGRAATVVSRDIHQAHGAIGFTLDHQLRHFTTRALAWNRDFGTPTQWSKELGRRALGSGMSVWEFAVAH
ncbi:MULTISPECIES: acyl-CoA dehydrogenase family protein [Rhodococcus]|uniref:Acyl-CoA dehydrogenase family protein n=1 Tax=Rhodococcus oxybenzonivorans TaxID=1990687 RepID=A0AAE5A6B4_9NOCA|nr:MULTISPECIES: acyl-CoA dehydrogenase family protein [Rhodococcus]MDV7241884.1 acyl-CoA dehydrogenase family protein [Rhodococcus oxybenzonivorans]MDV7265462.1 acyl-CoA dehydrogenase family protein [Rhodococcus oxybenzonivorans]MDV7273582.1 acyl-CoA dehydrogenase family protein [Rhodococcus oxybenzonivorans]MDV7334166.1 acyl-CoA dehydrogenase family protein [Rhodococcus oxybenzonivorans]MDV7343585.1 acyl-CoA dehydrogenase family protein [Rhodococcus oxybenzonivorans]